MRSKKADGTTLSFIVRIIALKGGEMPLLKFQEWSTARRVESLRQMDRMLSDLNVGSRYTIWQDWGGGLKATAEETHANWQRIAEDDEAYQNAIFCYMCCTLEGYTLSSFMKAKFKIEE